MYDRGMGSVTVLDAPPAVGRDVAGEVAALAGVLNVATARLVERIPLGRIAEPQDVVGPVPFFCGSGSDFVTGQIMYVDGGLTACQ